MGEMWLNMGLNMGQTTIFSLAEKGKKGPSLIYSIALTKACSRRATCTADANPTLEMYNVTLNPGC